MGGAIGQQGGPSTFSVNFQALPYAVRVFGIGWKISQYVGSHGTLIDFKFWVQEPSVAQKVFWLKNVLLKSWC